MRLFGSDLETKVVGLNNVEVGEDLSQQLTAEHRSLQRINQSITNVRGRPAQVVVCWLAAGEDFFIFSLSIFRILLVQSINYQCEGKTRNHVGWCFKTSEWRNQAKEMMSKVGIAD